MKKRILAIALLALLLVSVLTACGGSGSYSRTQGNSFAGDTKLDFAAAPAERDYAVGYESNEAYDQPRLQNENTPKNLKIIYSARITMESTEFDNALNALSALVERHGGWYQSSRMDNYGSGYRSGHYTVRVPAANFDAFCSAIGESAVIKNLESDSIDISDQYYDQEARLAAKRTTLDRYMSLLEKATEMSDIIELNRAIEDIELSIENLTGSLRKYDSLTDYATIDIRLDEVYRITPEEEPVVGFGAKFKAALKSGTEGLVNTIQNTALGFARHWPFFLTAIAVTVGAILVIRSSAKKDKARRQAARAAMNNQPVKPAQQPEKAKTDATNTESDK